MTVPEHPATRNNTPARLFHMFTLVRQTAAPGQTQTLSVWQQALQVPAGQDAEHTVANILKTMHSELSVIEFALKSHGVPSALIDPYLDQFRLAVGLTHLHGTINNVVAQFDPPAMLALLWFAYVLPDEGHPNTEALEQFMHEVSDLEKALQATGIPPAFRSHAEGILVGLKSAITMFPVQGTRALQPAVRMAVSDAHFDEEALKDAATLARTEPAVETLRASIATVVKSAASFTGDAEKVASIYTKVLGKAYEFGQFLSDVIGKST